MILKFLKYLFCFPHHYEQELSPFDDEWWEDELDVRVVERLSSLMEVKSE